MPTVKIRIEGDALDVVAFTEWLKHVARVSGVTKAYPARDGDDVRVYAVATADDGDGSAQGDDLQKLIAGAKVKADDAEAQGDTLQAAYWRGVLFGLELK